MRQRSAPKLARLKELRQRWQLLCDGLKIDWRLARQEGQQLVSSWDRLPRYYHDTTHLLACLRALEPVRLQLQNPQACELALWFHDAVYWPRRKDNEEQSAAWALRFMTAAGLDARQRDGVVQLVLETRHATLPSTGDAQYVVDADLGILGQPPSVYGRFEANVRKEYRFVPEADFRLRRVGVLQGFLDRPRIYSTEWFHSRLEQQARHNLGQAIAVLQA